ncbi:MAG: hypothetical protein AABX11_04340 [Nanoarchaeota archaeon]
MNPVETERRIRGLALTIGETSLNFGHGNCVVSSSEKPEDKKPEFAVERYHIAGDGSMKIERPGNYQGEKS